MFPFSGKQDKRFCVSSHTLAFLPLTLGLAKSLYHFFCSSVFRYPSPPQVSLILPWVVGALPPSKAGLSRHRWHSQDASSQRDAGVSGWDADGRSRCYKCCSGAGSICSSLFITSHRHVLVSRQEAERHGVSQRQRNEVNGENQRGFWKWLFL